MNSLLVLGVAVGSFVAGVYVGRQKMEWDLAKRREQDLLWRTQHPQRPSAPHATGFDWPRVDVPIAPRATMNIQADPYSLLHTLPDAVEQFYFHHYIMPEARKFDRWISSGEF